MGRDTLERKALRAIIRIDEKVSDICNTLYDIGLKLCHITDLPPEIGLKT